MKNIKKFLKDGVLPAALLLAMVPSLQGLALAEEITASTAAAPGARKLKPGQPVTIGYFHGGRTALMLRLYEDGEFEKKGLNVDYYAATLRSNDFKIVPKSIDEFNAGGTKVVGKTKGTELIDAMLAGKFDLAMVGESSFIHSIYAGKPIVAIAELGHDVKGQAGHVFMMRENLKTDKPSDYFGKVVVSRRAGPGDAIFLREYLAHEGVNLKTSAVYLKSLPKSLAEKRRLPKNKVLIAEDVYEDEMAPGLDNGVIDGGYFHLMGVPKRMQDFKIIKSLDDFANPELSHALLVCSKDFLAANREVLTKVLEVYIERIKYEHGLSYEERTKFRDKGLQMAMNLNGLNYPQYDLVPTVGVDLLYGIEGLLRKYSFIGKKEVKVEDYTDNSLVQAALKDLNLTEKDDVWKSKY
jgi:ABC-type nitrate/sulfonate/bicarbonate transport system substrate-binding protein